VLIGEKLAGKLPVKAIRFTAAALGVFTLSGLRL
jgi:hypothetical protein